MGKKCDGCGARVSIAYYRVFAVRDVLHSCLHCACQHGNHGPDADD